MSMINMSMFISDTNFCSTCGTILPMKTGSALLKCINCGRSTDLSSTRHSPKKTRVYLNAPTTAIASEAGHNPETVAQEGPIADRKCSKCDHQGLAYMTLQLRSADEGQTVIYTCPNCKSKEIENS